jgi:GNAT superfamily N-acetyltransferase
MSMVDTGSRHPSQPQQHDAAAGGLQFSGPGRQAGPDCERILRSLPAWFGIEQALQDYVADADRHPTFFAVAQVPVAFITLRQHGPQAWEVHCMAVHAACRGSGIGRRLHAHVEDWLLAQGAQVLQVKTLAPSHPSPHYAETRGFYGRLGYLPLEVFPRLWGPRLPVLQLVKWIGGRPAAAAPDGRPGL